MCIKNYLIILRPIFDATYKGENRPKNKCELYITNWSYSYKVGIVFIMYQIMRSNGTSWAGPRHVTVMLICLPYDILTLLLLWKHTYYDYFV